MKQLDGREQRLRAQKQLAVLMVLASIPISYFMFLKGPVSTYFENRNTLAVAQAEANQQSPTVRADEETSAAAKRALAPTSASAVEARVKAVADAAGAKVEKVSAKGKQVQVKLSVSSAPQLTEALKRLQGDLRFIDGGQIRVSGPVVVTDSVKAQRDGSRLEAQVVLQPASA